MYVIAFLSFRNDCSTFTSVSGRAQGLQSRLSCVQKYSYRRRGDERKEFIEIHACENRRDIVLGGWRGGGLGEMLNVNLLIRGREK